LTGDVAAYDELVGAFCTFDGVCTAARYAEPGIALRG
jgi:hypothetical protein